MIRLYCDFTGFFLGVGIIFSHGGWLLIAGFFALLALARLWHSKGNPI